MIGRIISQLLGGGRPDETGDALDEPLEFEEGGWVIVRMPAGPLLSPEEAADPLENLLIEHPSMSVYQMSRGAEDEREGSDEEEENLSPRPVNSPSSSAPSRRRVSWRLAAWGVPLPSEVLFCGRAAVERKKLSRGALLRQNLTAKARRSPPAERHVKQPSQRLYNY
ncbi:tumor protein p53-inducible nuclear protein 1 isoform X2 [Corythoichthys intestinalis]|uniref:tumor protein p53-inducible nuclear protein 1 isoform X2 n=1 Tax=Corythoichthys intestinalis TaxID=161448 RepID=UPI0025A589D0|nr:tumor protein p53-inducible nuclear protein 1 isoform X2 [Corythoichthys intestinalis]